MPQARRALCGSRKAVILSNAKDLRFRPTTANPLVRHQPSICHFDFAARPFIRFQFRIGLNISQALHAAGLYADELSETSALVSEGMVGHGWIVFTWLEPELFYINTTNLYSSTLDISIGLPSYGARVNKGTFTSDQIEMRTTMEGYELVLQTREQPFSSEPGRSIGLVLFTIPYKAFWAMQRGYEAHDE